MMVLLFMIIIADFVHDYYAVKHSLARKNNSHFWENTLQEYDELDLGEIQRYETKSWYVVLVCVVGGVYVILSCLLREHVRTRFELEGNLCFDFCAVVVCHHCSLRQMGVQSGVFEGGVCCGCSGGGGDGHGEGGIV